MTARPTAPRPQTATELLEWKFGLFITAPHPVGTPHPSRQAENGSLKEFSFAKLMEQRTEYSEKVEHPMK